MRVHCSSAKRLGSLLPVAIQQQKLAAKPSGLWWAVNSAWIDWCKAESFRTSQQRYTFSLDIDNTHILIIGRDMSIQEFTKSYGKTYIAPHDVLGYSINLSCLGPPHIDWSEVAKKYAGIEIPEYDWNSCLTLPWYYGWDVASGCIWDPAALRSEPKRIARSAVPKYNTVNDVVDSCAK